ncbi:MAG: redoxin domain-containing protein [Acidobacteriota bacterium]|nr:redoxin domain-containing protein [Acidobacteriota bacterium]
MSDHNRILNIALVVMVVALVVISGLLIHQNRQLRAMLESQYNAELEEIPRLEVGDVVEGFTLPALDGAQTNLDYTDRETLLLFFSPDCPACKTNFANWQAIEDSDLGDNRRVVFISTVDEERTRQYVADKNLRSEVLVGSPSVLDRYKVARIPTTVQVGPGGVVNGVWIGVLSEAVVAEL